MELVIAKDWAGNKKGSKVTITDKTVIEKGYELGVFEKPKKKQKLIKKLSNQKIKSNVYN